MSLEEPSRGPVNRLVAAFDEMTALIRMSDDPVESMRSITMAATTVIDGCDAASLSLVTPDGPVTKAVTDELAAAGDRIQYSEGEGPCLDAAMRERYAYTPDLAADPRWGRSSSRIAHELGVGSMLACRLASEATPSTTLGALNLYARAPAAFTDDDIALAVLLASLSHVVVESAHRRANLLAAMESREVIGEAIGIIRAQSNVSRPDALGYLVRASQRMNTKLRVVAQRIADGPRAITDEDTA